MRFGRGDRSLSTYRRRPPFGYAPRRPKDWAWSGWSFYEREETGLVEIALIPSGESAEWTAPFAGEGAKGCGTRQGRLRHPSGSS